MANKQIRQERIELAKQIIHKHPEYGRRLVARDLRKETGGALRDSVILSLQREIFPIPVSMERKRRIRYKQKGFLPFEAKEISRQVLVRADFLAKERNKRERDHIRFVKRFVAEGGTKSNANKAWRDSILDRYAAEGWQLEDGTNDPWQMFRAIRAEAIKLGTWKETPRYLKSHRKLRTKLDKGDIKKQRQRYRDRQSAKRGNRKKRK